MTRLSGLPIVVIHLVTAALPALAAAAPAAPPPELPWQREMPLRETAQSVALQSKLNPTNPQPDSGGGPFGGPSMTINNLKMRSTIWGPPDRITISVTKNDVWDRRLHEFPAPTLREIIDGAFAPVNKDYVGVRGNSLRPVDLGWLRKEGGPYDPYRKPMRYAFPSLKPVGQIIIGIDDLAGAEPPALTQNCGNGLVKLTAARGDAKAAIECVLGMTSNTYAIRGDLAGIRKSISLRLYRHRDTSHLMYMTPDGKHYTNPAAEADKAFNGPIDPPASGQDGRRFWIRQKMPPEKTFPRGFEYVLMGVVTSPGEVKLESVEGQTHLGTPPLNQRLNGEWKNAVRPAIADAPGAAATATFTPGGEKFAALVTVATTNDGLDIMAVARQRLAQMEPGGFEGVLRENVRWWNAFYDRREDGRVFYGSSGGRNATDDIRAIYRSWTCNHGGGTKTDMRRFEGSASYALPERDFQEWDSSPCYNEIFHTSRFVRNWGDSVDMYKQLLWHWLPGARRNAREMFGMPGMLISHGYLPPVKPDRYVHTTITLELCLGTMAQILRPVWDEWDYGGDVRFLREECYPLMREMALFYAAYARRGSDGYYHVIPSMEEERWGIYPQFARNKDVISSLCMFQWGLTRAADAAEFLGVDAPLRDQWREVAAHLAPYPTWQKPQGIIFAGMPGVEPMHLPGDHFGDAAAYPTILADEINLDSPQDQREKMIRSVTTLRSGSTAEALLLLGQREDPAAGNRRRSAGGDAEALLNSRSGRIHLFPAVAPSSEVAFRHFQARGGFLVSAARNARGVYYVEIQPRRDNSCHVMNPWPGKPVVVRDAGSDKSVVIDVDRADGECIVFPALANHTYRVEPAGARDTVLWYRQPATKWLEALPMGNGLMGAMVFGGIQQERIALNEGTFWSGRPHDYDNPDAIKYFTQIRDLVFAGKFQEAERMADEHFFGVPAAQQAFQPLGDLNLTFDGVDKTDEYRRELDMGSGIATTTYRAGDARITREVFVSYPDRVMVVRIAGDKPGRISLQAELKSAYLDSVSARPGMLVMDGQWKGPIPVNNPLIAPVEGKGIRCRVVLTAAPEGGQSDAANGALHIHGADAVTLIVAAATSFVNYHDISGDPAARCDKALARCAGKDYAELRRRHVEDFHRLMGRVSLDVGDRAMNDKPTDERLRTFREKHDDPNLEGLCFQFGRYLLASSSRAGGQPANLQGIWDESVSPSWGSKYTININTEMNYWPAEACNLSECHQPLFDMLRDISVTGAKTARTYYGHGGWVAHHNVDLWRGTAPVDAARFGMWPVGGAWLCQHLWEHYAFTGDRAFLKEHYPVLRGAAQFLLELLVEEPNHHWLVTPFSMSPEHGYYDGNGKLAFLSPGPTLDIAIIRELFPHCIEASEVLGLDADFRDKLEAALKRLPPYRINQRGFLQE